MSHLANNIVVDNKIDSMHWLFTLEVERADEMEQELAEVELEEWDAEQELFNDHTR
jgi:hypothetical protein